MGSHAPAALDRLRGIRRSRYRVLLPDDLRRLLPVVVPVTTAGAALLLGALAALDFPTREAVAGFITLLLAAAITEAFPVPIEGVAAGRTSLATIFIVGGGVIYGWPTATALGFTTMATVEVTRRRPPSRVAFNVGLYTLAAGAGGAAASLVADGDLGSLVLAAVCGSSAFYVVDIALLAAVIARSSGTPFFSSYGRAVYSTLLPFGVIASLTVILVVLWDRSPFVAIALIAPLVAIALYQRWVHAALDRLRELDRLKNEFVAVVSHELRTPIASVYGAAQTLQRMDLDRAQRDSLLSVIYGESARLARLVDQVLWASRLEAGPVGSSVDSCDAVELAAEVVAAARTHVPDDLSLELLARGELPPVAADREKLKQVLVNLIENAVKYSPPGSVIELSAERQGDVVRIAVADRGVGVPAGEEERIFEPFYRPGGKFDSSGGGAGLGLSIARRMAEAQGGAVGYAPRDGGGSVFELRLPAASAGEPAAERTPSASL
jgi:signal transduction histidine kinase